MVIKFYVRRLSSQSWMITSKKCQRWHSSKPFLNFQKFIREFRAIFNPVSKVMWDCLGFFSLLRSLISLENPSPSRPIRCYLVPRVFPRLRQLAFAFSSQKFSSWSLHFWDSEKRVLQSSVVHPSHILSETAFKFAACNLLCIGILSVAFHNL